ncbi:MAG: hypothetical protein ABI771_12525 [Betaproteobacteria bacterium]
MNTKIAILFAGMMVASGFGAARAAMEVKDPDEAQIVAVDRFSESAAHLQVRTAANGIPGPNVPVDFDTGPFITEGLSPDGTPVRYYNFDVRSAKPAPLYVLYRMGETQPVEGQLDVIDALPGDDGYNDFHQVWTVAVPPDYQANSITSAVEIRDAGYPSTKTDTLRNTPVVPDKSVARTRLNGDNAALQRGWYRGRIVKYFSFNEASLSAGGSDAVPVSPIFVAFNVNPDQPNGGPASGFYTEPGSRQTHNVVSTLPRNPAYSPLWLVSVYDNGDWSTVSSLDTVTKARILAVAVASVNCPIVFVTP